LQFTEHFFSVSVEDNAAISALAPVLGISLLFNLIVIISLILAFSSQQQSDSFRREVKNKKKGLTYCFGNSFILLTAL